MISITRWTQLAITHQATKHLCAQLTEPVPVGGNGQRLIKPRKLFASYKKLFPIAPGRWPAHA